uniref:Putative secreted protein n=1 Tax=Anopheles darlingi TaxID=43151 RepID=A0A2M4D1D0_ANODA
MGEPTPLLILTTTVLTCGSHHPMAHGGSFSLSPLLRCSSGKLLTYQIVQVQVEPMKVHRKAFSRANTNGSRPPRRHQTVPGISCTAWPVAVG